jgi:hypothetical protein
MVAPIAPSMFLYMLGGLVRSDSRTACASKAENILTPEVRFGFYCE